MAEQVEQVAAVVGQRHRAMSAAAVGVLAVTEGAAEWCGLFTIRSLILEPFRQSRVREVLAVLAAQKLEAA
jgi:hypothetical protein